MDLQQLVQAGEEVTSGQLLGVRRGRAGYPVRVHSPLSGKVHLEPHWLELQNLSPTPPLPEKPSCRKPSSTSPEDLLERIRRAGVVGHGGGEMCTATKLAPGSPVDVVLINGCESEPYLSGDHRVLQEFRPEVECGLALAQYILGAQDGHLVIPGVNLDESYEGGYEALLVERFLGRSLAPRQRVRDLGVVVLNVQTARAIHRAICQGAPLTERIVTVAGEAVAHPGNYRLLLGTPLSHVWQACGLYPERASRLLAGGPMMGAEVLEQDLVRPGTTGLLALISSEIQELEEGPCIRCGSCLDVCPSRLFPPTQIASPDARILDCITCGLCDYVCPAGRHLVHGLEEGKNTLRKTSRRNS
jgi:electron transport complex protein RnfC